MTAQHQPGFDIRARHIPHGKGRASDAHIQPIINACLCTHSPSEAMAALVEGIWEMLNDEQRATVVRRSILPPENWGHAAMGKLPPEAFGTEQVVCSVCKSTRVQSTFWLDHETGSTVEHFTDYDETSTGGVWCADCQEHTPLDIIRPHPALARALFSTPPEERETR